MEEIVTIFTDGSADNRVLDFGGAAAVIRYKDTYKEIVSGSWSSTTNNRMELLGIILGLDKVRGGFKICLTTDSEVCLKWIAQLQTTIQTESEILNSKNGDLLLRLNKLLIKHKGNVSFKWVRGHIGVKDNERCDLLAGDAAIQPNPTRDIGSMIEDCIKYVWIYDSMRMTAFLGHENYENEMEYVNGELENEIVLGDARKVSKKEIGGLLRDIGMKPKEIKDINIDLSYYVKPNYYGRI
jgi:ribonuclease HI